MNFYIRGRLSKRIDAFFISLIPTKKGPWSIGNYHPISLTGSVFKILSHVLATCLQKMLFPVVSFAQGPFGTRNTSSRWGSNSKWMFVLEGQVVNGLIDLLTGPWKACDRVISEFLVYMLRRMCFGIRWQQGIKKCDTLVTILIIIGGSYRLLPSLKGPLRQGDPLPPFLFHLKP